jgi:cysteine-rich repeat protein
VTFKISVVPHPDANVHWLPTFRSSRGPQISAQGELTFSIERGASKPQLLEHQSRRFQLLVVLIDGGGTENGGSDTSTPEAINVVLIGTPQTVRFVRSVADAPRTLLVTWFLSDEAAQASSMIIHEAPGKVTFFIVELRSWTQYGQLVTEYESVVNFAAESTRGSVLFEDLDLAKEYVPIVSACNCLVCSNTQSGASSFAFDLPSRPDEIQIRRRSRFEVVISWPLPVDQGDGNPYENTQSSIPLGFRLQIFSSSSPEAIATESSLGWENEVVIDAEHHEMVFSEEHAGEMMQLSVVFVNQVGNSPVEQADFMIDEIDCDVVCGDSVRASSEGCDDGNLVAGDGCSEVCTVEFSYFCIEVSEPDFRCLPKLYGKSECKLPAFVTLRLEPETDMAGVNNEILVSFLANFDILPDRDILLHGLTGSDTSTISLMAEEFDIGLEELLRKPCRWDQYHGVLKLQLQRRLPANTLVVFSFTLRNPSHTQPPQKVAIHCDDSHCCANSPVLHVASAEQPSAALGVVYVEPACLHVNMTQVLMGIKKEEEEEEEEGVEGGEVEDAEEEDELLLEATGVYGPACDKICFGLVQGDECKCEPNHFGDDCSLYLEADPARSLSQIVRVGEAISLGSVADTRVGVESVDKDGIAAVSMRAFDGKVHRMRKTATDNLRARRSMHMDGTHVALTIPEGALMETTLIRADVFPILAAVPGAQNELSARAEVVELRPHGIVFAKPVTVHMRTPMLITSEQLRALQIDIMFHDDVKNEWLPANGTAWRVDESCKQINIKCKASLLVSAQTLHFSRWSIFSRPLPRKMEKDGLIAPASTPAPSGAPATPASTTSDKLARGNSMAVIVGIILAIASGALILIVIVVMLLRRRKALAFRRAVDLELKRKHLEEEEKEAERTAQTARQSVSAEEAMSILQEKSAVVSADYVYSKSGELREVPMDDLQTGRATHNNLDKPSAHENMQQVWKLPHDPVNDNPFLLIPAPPSPTIAAAERELAARRIRKEERQKLRELRNSRRGARDSSRPGAERSLNHDASGMPPGALEEDSEARLEHKLKDLIRASLKGIAQVCICLTLRYVCALRRFCMG